MKDIEIFLEKWQASVLDYLPKLAIAILVMVGFYFIAKLLKKFSLKFYSRVFKKEHAIAKIISIAIYIFFLLSGIFLGLEILGLDSVLTKVLAGAGILGVIAGFAFKDIASNAFAGILLHMQNPFKENDIVKIVGNFGTVTKIGWITTSIKTIGGEEVFVPNQMIYSNSFKNYSSWGKRRIIFKSGVSYGDDLELVKRAALEEVDKVENVLKNEDIDFFFTGIGSSAYDFELRFWVAFQTQNDYLNAMSDIVMLIKKRFEKENISLAYSVTTLDFGVKGGVNIFDKPISIKQDN